LKTLRDVGEREIIRKMFDLISKNPRTPIQLGDDLAAVELEKGKLACLKCDMLVRNTDIPPGMTFYQAGRKAVVSVVSDFASKGIKPLAILSSLGLPQDFNEKDVEELMRGLDAGVREYGAYIIGGDTNEACDLIVDCIGFGLGNLDSYVSRTGAKPGDLVAVTGSFGETAAGLKMISNGYSLSPAIEHRFKRAIYMPKARLDEGLALAKTKALSSSIDSSDGLALSLYDLSKQSKVGFKIESVPVSKDVEKFANANNLDPLSLALYGGEEYELVFTFKSKEEKKIQKATKEDTTIIGEVIPQRRVMLETKKGLKEIVPKGWNHFQNK
jgi:thiamine-monophosphate kinase